MPVPARTWPVPSSASRTVMAVSAVLRVMAAVRGAVMGAGIADAGLGGNGEVGQGEGSDPAGRRG